jgi:magnesium transporter
MVMLTEVLRFDVTDEKGREARIDDLSIALLDDDYPPVTGLIVRAEAEEESLIPWENVRSFDVVSKRIFISDLESAMCIEPSKDIRLKRDILDSLILDLLGRRTTRVCDLMLEEQDGTLRLKAVDAGFVAMLRRVFRGRWFKTDPRDLFDWKYVEFLRGDPNAVDNGAGYRLRINRLPAGEIARLADYVPYLHAAELLKLLPDEKAVDVLEATSIDRQVQIFEELDETEAIALLCKMSPDLATDLIGRLEFSTMRRYLNLMPPKCRNRVIELLRFPEGSVGGAMTNDIVSLAADMSCREAKEHVQEMLETVDFSTVVFVVNNETECLLRGSLNLRDLLSADDHQKLDDLMDPYIQSLSPFDDATDAAYRMVSGQLPAMPVTNNDGKLIGAMTIEASIARLVPTTGNLQRLRVFS